MTNKTSKMNVDVDLNTELNKIRQDQNLSYLDMRIQAIQTQNVRHALFIAAVKDARKPRLVIKRSK